MLSWCMMLRSALLRYRHHQHHHCRYLLYSKLPFVNLWLQIKTAPLQPSREHPKNSAWNSLFVISVISSLAKVQALILRACNCAVSRNILVCGIARFHDYNPTNFVLKLSAADGHCFGNASDSKTRTKWALCCGPVISVVVRFKRRLCSFLHFISPEQYSFPTYYPIDVIALFGHKHFTIVFKADCFYSIHVGVEIFP